jgi:hypothetical protein
MQARLSHKMIHYVENLNMRIENIESKTQKLNKMFQIAGLLSLYAPFLANLMQVIGINSEN